MKIDIPQEILSSFPQENIFYDQSMSCHTSIGTGGKIAVMFIPKTVSQLCFLIKELRTTKYTVIGNGTGILVSDKGYRGFVIKTSKIKGIDHYGKYMTVLAGETMKDVSLNAMHYGLTGIEWMSSDRGTLGAAISNNVSFFGKEIKSYIYAVEIITHEGKIITLNKNDLKTSNKSTNFLENGYTVLRAILCLEKSDSKLIERRMGKYKCISSEEKSVTAFSEIKKHGSTSRLIEECGLLGRVCGGASICPKNPLQIINSGIASSQDVFNLINDTVMVVLENTGIHLKYCVKLLGKF